MEGTSLPRHQPLAPPVPFTEENTGEVTSQEAHGCQADSIPGVRMGMLPAVLGLPEASALLRDRLCAGSAGWCPGAEPFG